MTSFLILPFAQPRTKHVLIYSVLSPEHLMRVDCVLGKYWLQQNPSNLLSWVEESANRKSPDKFGLKMISKPCFAAY